MFRRKPHLDIDQAWELAAEILGRRSGVMLSGSKSASPERKVVWNGNVCVKELGKIWYGDISLTESKERLQDLADRLGASVYVLHEHDARFRNEDKPLYEESVARFDPQES